MDKNTNELRDALLAVAKEHFGDEYNNHDNETQNNYDYLFGLLCNTVKVVAAEGVNAFREFSTEPFVSWHEVDVVEVAMTLGPVVANVCPDYEIAADTSRERVR